MLVQLVIRDIVLIERLDIKFEAGLSVLTGETGAGKSILLDALSLSLGGRGDGGLVRHGANEGQVSAIFDVESKHPLRRLLREHGFEDDGDIILRRIQEKDGRSRAFINDQPTSITLLRQIGRDLVEIHGQHADRALVDISHHRALLDAFGRLEEMVEIVARSFHDWQQAEKKLKAQRSLIEKAAREADYLQASVEELGTLAPEQGEEEELAGRRAAMMKAERIAGDIHEAIEIVTGSHSPVPIIANLARRLERKNSDSGIAITPIIEALDRSLIALDEAQTELDEVARALDFDPKELEQTEERLFALRAAARKYGVAVDSLPQLREKLDAQLAAWQAGEESLAQLENETAQKLEIYDKNALALSEQRHKAAKQLEQAVMAQLPALKLERAEFIINLNSDSQERGEQGIDRVEYFVRTNPGTRPGSLIKTASGGELSRFLLALKVALAERGTAPTLIFDEIDTGVGGAVADAIGMRLHRLARKVQVLSVTHAPQVAARANHHFLIAKTETENKERVVTSVQRMSELERQEEIARMLAGEHITNEARAAAAKLLQANQKQIADDS